MVETPDFEELYEEFHQKILYYLKRMIGEHEAEDVSQEVFDKVHRALPGFRGESKLSTWIFRIATNTALDRLKSTTFKRSPAGPLASFPIHDQEIENHLSRKSEKPVSEDQRVIRHEMNACIREYIDNLPPDYRTIIVLNELEGFTNQEIADILQVSLDAAKIRLHRARARLKKDLEKGCDFYYDERTELACDRKQPNGGDSDHS